MTSWKQPVIYILLLLIHIQALSQEIKLEYYQNLKKQLSVFDQPLSHPGAGDWLSIHPEPGQTFKQFIKSNPGKRDIKRKTIYLRPIGTFSKEQQKVVVASMEYIEIFFGLKVKMQDSIALKNIPNNARRRFKGQMQLWTNFINYKLLYPDLPADAVASMAITPIDLYTYKNSNYVFGEADQLNKIGVSSMARYKITDSASFNLCLKRMIKTTSHEIGHMLGLEHCIHATCTMNGSNSLDESDKQPVFLCSDCSAKVCWAANYQQKERLDKLKIFFQKYGFRDEAILCDKMMVVIK